MHKCTTCVMAYVNILYEYNVNILYIFDICFAMLLVKT